MAITRHFSAAKKQTQNPKDFMSAVFHSTIIS